MEVVQAEVGKYGFVDDRKWFQSCFVRRLAETKLCSVAKSDLRISDVVRTALPIHLRRMGGMQRKVETKVTYSQNEPWLNADLLFLKISLGQGMSFAEVAGFLGRPADEVRDKARRLTPKRTKHSRRGISARFTW